MTEKTGNSEVDRHSFTDWANEPKVSDLKQNITDAKPDNDKHILNVDKWLNNMDMTGSAAVKKIPGRSSVAPKVIRKQAEWRYSSLTEPFLSTPDIFNIYPVTAGDVNRAEQNQLVLNNQINTKLNKVRFIDQYVRAGVDSGTIIVKVGWRNEDYTHMVDKPIYEFTPEPTGQLAQQYMNILMIQQQNPEQYFDIDNPGLRQALETFKATGVAMIPQLVDYEEVEVTETTHNHPSWEIKDRRNIIVDPSCDGDYEKAGFIGEWFKSSIAALKADGKYENLDAINVEASNPLADPDYVNNSDNDSFAFTGMDPRKQFVVHEYWGTYDIHGDGTTVPIVAAWVGDTLIRMEENPFPDQKPPFVFVPYLPVRRSVFGEPDGALLEENQKIIGAITRGSIDLMGKSANGQTGIRRDLLDVTNRRRFNRGEDYEFNVNVDPRVGVHHHTYPEIPNSVFNMITMQNNDAESLTGVKAFNSGVTGDSLGKSATLGRSALDASSKREIGILRRLADGMIQIGRKFVSMNAEFLSEEEVVRITAKDFVTVRREDLAGNFDLTLAISTAEEDNQKAQELAFMLQTNGPNSDPAETRIIRAEIARLRKMPELAKKIEEYQPQPDPLAVAKAQMELKLLEAQIAKEQALGAKHTAEAEAAGARGFKDVTQGNLNTAKADEAGGKGREANAKADKMNLDTVEQETGVKQERELQKERHKGEVATASKIIEQKSAPNKEGSEASKTA